MAASRRSLYEIHDIKKNKDFGEESSAYNTEKIDEEAKSNPYYVMKSLKTTLVHMDYDLSTICERGGGTREQSKP